MKKKMKLLSRIVLAPFFLMLSSFAAGTNSFEFRNPSDNSTKGTIDTNGNAIIYGTATVLGNAFSVGGSSFIVNGGSATVGYRLSANSVSASTLAATATGSSVFSLSSSSGMSVANGPVWLADGGGGYIRFTDGTTMKTAPSGGGGNTIVISSDTNNITGATGTNTIAGACLAGSSVPFNTSNTGYCDIYLNAVIGSSSLGGTMYIGVRVDGITYPITTTDNPPTHTNIGASPAAPSGGGQVTMPFHIGIGGLSTNATHTVCFFGYANTGTWSLASDGQTNMNFTRINCL